MNSNLHQIEKVIEYIELHLQEDGLDLDTISRRMGYSKYHLHRMFTFVVGFTLHHYIQRRRLTEAARLLVSTDTPVLEIALRSGYDTQRSFSRAFKNLYHLSPHSFRKKDAYMPIQLKHHIDQQSEQKGDMILDIQTAEVGEICLIGYRRSTKFGFQAIGTCWRLLHAGKNKITGRTDPHFLIGVNDYSRYESQSARPVFDYFAGAQVHPGEPVPKGMKDLLLPSSKYVVFHFRGRCEDSLQPVAEFIYQRWFPNSTCRFNEHNPYDFVKYGEAADEKGISDIQYWIPIL